MAKNPIADWASYVSDVATALARISSLEENQRNMSETIREMGHRVRDLESDMKSLSSEVKFEALKETQVIVNGVQGSLNQRIENLRADLTRLEEAALRFDSALSLDGKLANEERPKAIPKG